MRNNNVLIRHNEEYERVEGLENGVILHLKSGKKIKADAFLWSNGRTGNTDKLGLENIGLKANSRGQVQVDEHYRTEIGNIYAAGDVIGWPSLASAAYDQGRSAAGALSRTIHGVSSMTCRRASTPFRRSARSARTSVS